jgi:hypothetical protein
MTESTSGTRDGLTPTEDVIHQLTNHLSVVIGFADVLLHQLPQQDPMRADVVEMHRAAHAAIALLSGLRTREP